MWLQQRMQRLQQRMRMVLVTVCNVGEAAQGGQPPIVNCGSCAQIPSGPARSGTYKRLETASPYSMIRRGTGGSGPDLCVVGSRQRQTSPSPLCAYMDLRIQRVWNSSPPRHRLRAGTQRSSISRGGR